MSDPAIQHPSPCGTGIHSLGTQGRRNDCPGRQTTRRRRWPTQKKQICRGFASQCSTTQGIQGQGLKAELLAGLAVTCVVADRVPTKVWQGWFVGWGALYCHTSATNGHSTRLRLLCLRCGKFETVCLTDSQVTSLSSHVQSRRRRRSIPCSRQSEWRALTRNSLEVELNAQGRPPKPQNKPPRARSEPETFLFLCYEFNLNGFSLAQKLRGLNGNARLDSVTWWLSSVSRASPWTEDRARAGRGETGTLSGKKPNPRLRLNAPGDQR